jgi:hypothetical protein
VGNKKTKKRQKTKRGDVGATPFWFFDKTKI